MIQSSRPRIGRALGATAESVVTPSVIGPQSSAKMRMYSPGRAI